MARYRKLGLVALGFVTFLFSTSFLYSDQLNDPTWCGNKHKNLVRLKNTLQGIPNVEVPEFIGIPSHRIEKFLKAHVPEIFDDYVRAVRILNNPNAKPTVMDKIRYALGFKKTPITILIDRIQNKVKNAFTGKDFEFTKEEKELFSKIALNDQFFMVRSTGVEDSETVANAGGNASIAYVDPYERAIREAMGEVDASYFGLQSLKNRQMGGEILSANDLCLPVLIQRLIGESVNGTSDPTKIPISGVAFTTNTSLGTSTFSVTEINASYGHGEGIVANRVIADRYYITPSKNKSEPFSLYPIIYEKEHRLVPRYNNQLQRYELVTEKNPTALASKSALSQEQIARLYTTLKVIEADYGQPMDVEFVILGPTLYIVQARPAMRHEKQPSYIDIESIPAATISECITTSTLVAGKADVLAITDPASLLICKTLDEADQDPRSAQVKAVIVNSWASPLSHAAVNFTAHGIPCLYVQNSEAVKKIITQTSPEQPLIIDIQRHKLFQWNNTNHTYRSFVRQGWFEHPLECVYSFIDGKLNISSTTHHIPRDAKLVALMESFKSAPTNKQKDIISRVKERVICLLNLTEKKLRTLGTTNATVQAINSGFEQFKATFEQLYADLIVSIEHNADRLEILFYHKMLEALLYQNTETQKIINGYTYSCFLDELFTYQPMHVMMNRLSRTGNSITLNQEPLQRFNYAQFCSTAELSDQWRMFLVEVMNYKEADESFIQKLNSFYSMLETCKSINILPLWFATDFYQATYKRPLKTMTAPEKQEFMRNFVEQHTNLYDAQAHNFLTTLAQYIPMLHHISATKSDAPYQTLTTLAQVIHMRLVEPLTSAQFCEDFQKAPFFVKITACEVMRTCIDTLDAILKGIKTNSTLSTEQRDDLFKHLLTDFKLLFTTWAQNIMPVDALKYHPAWPLYKYVRELDTLFEDIMNKPLDMHRSASFAVNAAILGSGTAFERHYPESAEDIFMLIHQNNLAVVSALYGSLFEEKPLDESLWIPSFMQEAIHYFESDECNAKVGSYIGRNISERINKPERIGISYTKEMIKILYNMSLRNHSSTFQINYNQLTKECTLSVQFLGQSRDRWEQVALLAALSTSLSGLHLEDAVNFDKQAGIVSWNWIISRKEQLPLILDYLIATAELSFEHDLTISTLERLYKGNDDFNQLLQKALRDYEKTYEKNNVTRYLLQELEELA